MIRYKIGKIKTDILEKAKQMKYIGLTVKKRWQTGTGGLCTDGVILLRPSDAGDSI